MRVLLGVLAFELDDPPPPALHPRLLCPFSILQKTVIVHKRKSMLANPQRTIHVAHAPDTPSPIVRWCECCNLLFVCIQFLSWLWAKRIVLVLLPLYTLLVHPPH
ncbi:hypothetical protein LINPERPRIM_LOCUS7228 [Linum perenne]